MENVVFSVLRVFLFNLLKMWPFLLNIYKTDMIFETPTNIDLLGYPADSILYPFSLRIEHVLSDLQGAIAKLF